MRGPGACTGWGACGPGSCRDKGRGGVDGGGLVLVLVGVRPGCSTKSPLARVATRTSTRPPPCPTSAPCPYRTGTRAFPIRLSTIIRTGNAHDPMRSSTVIRRGADPLPVRCCGPGSCRDKGRGGVDEGAWCLSWLGCDLFAPRNPHWLALPPGQAQGPLPAPHPPLVPTGRVTHITPFGRQNSVVTLDRSGKIRSGGLTMTATLSLP